jgi:predicted deacylase
VLYRDDANAEANKAKAEALLAKQEAMIQAYGHTVINEFPVEKYIDEQLHRSTSAAVLSFGGIPGLTVELGTGHMPDPEITQAAVAGTRNIMRWAGMLGGDMEPIEGIIIVDPGFATRRCSTPRVAEACVVLHLVEPGDMVRQGDAVAECRDVWGRPIGSGIIQSEFDGFVIGRSHGIYYYPGDPILGLAIRDEHPLVAPYPADFYK